MSRQHCSGNGAVLGCGEKERGFIGVKNTAAGLQVSPGSLSAPWQNRRPALHCSARLQERVPGEGVQEWGRIPPACQYCTIQPQTLQSCQCRCWVGAPQLSASTAAWDVQEELQEQELCPCSEGKLRHSVVDYSGRSVLAVSWGAGEQEDELLGQGGLVKTPAPGHIYG